jgi:hypothetical protein
MDHRDLAVAGAKNLEIDNPGVLDHAPHSRGWDFSSQPSAFAVAPLEVLLRSLPPFPVYGLAGAVDGGKGGGEDVSGDCGNAGAFRVSDEFSKDPLVFSSDESCYSSVSKSLGALGPSVYISLRW